MVIRCYGCRISLSLWSPHLVSQEPSKKVLTKVAKYVKYLLKTYLTEGI